MQLWKAISKTKKQSCVYWYTYLQNITSLQVLYWSLTLKHNITSGFILIFDPKNIGLDNIKSKIILNIDGDIDKFKFLGEGHHYWFPVNFQ